MTGQKSSKVETKDNLDVPSLPRIEVIRRLRERLQPIILFNETEIEACERLRILEINEPDHSEGRVNDLKEIKEAVEKDQDHQAAQGSSKGKYFF